MAVNYTYEYRTSSESLPYKIPDKIVYKDVDASVAELVQQIENYILAGNYAAASDLMTENEELLEGYKIDATDINRIIEDIRNTQIYARSRKQEIYFESDEPEFLEHDDVWISSAN